MDYQKVFLTLAIPTFFLISPNTLNNKQTETPNIKHKVYNHEKNLFNPNPGGIQEETLNMLKGVMRWDENTHLIEMMQKYDEIERKNDWIPLKEKDATWEKDELKKAIYENFQILKHVYTTPNEELIKEEEKLKYVLDEIEKSSHKFSGLKQSCNLLNTITCYETINKKIINKVQTQRGTMNLLEIMDKKYGDCTELVATNYSILNFFGINTYIKFGKKGPDAEKTHTWLEVKISDQLSFELDPMMKIFGPLDERNPEIKSIQYKGLHTQR